MTDRWRQSYDAWKEIEDDEPDDFDYEGNAVDEAYEQWVGEVEQQEERTVNHANV